MDETIDTEAAYQAALTEYRRAQGAIVTAKAEYTSASIGLQAAKLARDLATPRRPTGRPRLEGGSRSEREKDARRAARSAIQRAKEVAREEEREISHLEEVRLSDLRFEPPRRAWREAQRAVVENPNDMALQYALDEAMSAMWGGLSPEQRRLRSKMDQRRALLKHADSILKKAPSMAAGWAELAEALPPSIAALEDALMDLATKAARM